MTIAPRIAAFAASSLALGAGIALLVPTELRTARNTELDRLSQPHIVMYPGERTALSGPDSYPVVYSPQWLAVAQQAERARTSRWDLPPAPPVGYDQPPPESDAAVEQAGAMADDSARQDDRAASADPGDEQATTAG